MSSAVEFVLRHIVVIMCSVAWASAGTHFSSLPNTLEVIATINSSTTTVANAAMAGRDQLVVSWWAKELSSPWVDSEYKTVKVKLCFGPVSQVDRQWRKTDDDLKKDKTCQFDITERSYDSNINRNTIKWTVGRKVPKAIYFVRAYALNALGNEVAYGQTSNLFMVEAISGRHASLDIATVVCSAFSIVFILGFFTVEKWSAKKAALQKK
uniref:High-affinity nitrate transporter n=1 Tax=Pinus pinaster TaxID=71647 RepID=A0A1S6YCN0_PINPS|nr:NRT3 family protein [Pinus pinaster]